MLSCVEAAPVAPLATVEVKEKTKIKDFNGQEVVVTKEDLYSQSVMQRKDWTAPEIDEAWKILEKYKDPVRDWFKFCEGTIQNLRKIARIQELKSKLKCKPKKKEQPTLNAKLPITREEHLAKGTLVPAPAELIQLLKRLKK